jgi:hypothetical protein
LYPVETRSLIKLQWRLNKNPPTTLDFWNIPEDDIVQE